jgi:hypothetical protein
MTALKHLALFLGASLGITSDLQGQQQTKEKALDQQDVLAVYRAAVLQAGGERGNVGFTLVCVVVEHYVCARIGIHLEVFDNSNVRQMLRDSMSTHGRAVQIDSFEVFRKCGPPTNLCSDSSGYYLHVTHIMFAADSFAAEISVGTTVLSTSMFARGSVAMIYLKRRFASEKPKENDDQIVSYYSAEGGYYIWEVTKVVVTVTS